MHSLPPNLIHSATFLTHKYMYDEPVEVGLISESHAMEALDSSFPDEVYAFLSEFYVLRGPL